MWQSRIMPVLFLTFFSNESSILYIRVANLQLQMVKYNKSIWRNTKKIKLSASVELANVALKFDLVYILLLSNWPNWNILSNLPRTVGPSYSTFVQDGNLCISYYRFALVLSILLCLALRLSLTRIIRLNVLNFQGLLHRRCYHTFKLNSDSSINCSWMTHIRPMGAVRT